jgi:CheY-like chemotaxis protein
MAFVDMQMPPGWDGVKTAQAICRLDSDIQIVICSAYTDYSRQELFTIIGNNDRLVLLSKPFDAVETLELANELTEKWRLIHSNRNKIPSNCPEGGKQEK